MKTTCLILSALALAACATTKGGEKTSAAPKAAAPSEAKRLPGPSPLEIGAPAGKVERIFVIKPTPRAPRLGSETAKVTVEVCSDFQCPYCARLVPTVHDLIENYGELVKVLWRNCPLPFHEHALPAAEAATEVYTQAGDKGFWAYHDKLFANQDALGADSLVTLAKDIEGVDADKLRGALADHRHAPQIQKDLEGVVDSGAAAGGFGTPATFVNGRLISGAQPYEVFEAAVERALAEPPEARAQAEANSEVAYPMARARHILIQYTGAQGAEARVTRSKDEARALATQLHGRVVNEHADLAKLAREKSDCPSAPEGGELGRFTRGELVPEFEAALFALEPGQISAVVETPFGFHIIMREE